MKVVTDFKSIAKNYLSSWFMIDFVSGRVDAQHPNSEKPKGPKMVPGRCPGRADPLPTCCVHPCSYNGSHYARCVKICLLRNQLQLSSSAVRACSSRWPGCERLSRSALPVWPLRPTSYQHSPIEASHDHGQPQLQSPPFTACPPTLQSPGDIATSGADTQARPRLRCSAACGSGDSDLRRNVSMLLLPERLHEQRGLHRGAVRQALQARTPLSADQAATPCAPRPPHHQIPGGTITCACVTCVFARPLQVGARGRGTVRRGAAGGEVNKVASRASNRCARTRSSMGCGLMGEVSGGGSVPPACPDQSHSSHKTVLSRASDGKCQGAGRTISLSLCSR